MSRKSSAKIIYTGNVLLCVVTMCILCDLPFNTPADPGIVRTAKSTSIIK